MRRDGWIGAVAIGVGAALFAWWNRGETMTVHVGPFSIYRAPVAWMLLGAFVLGMLALFLIGLRGDLHARRNARGQAVVRPAVEHDVPTHAPQTDTSDTPERTFGSG